MARTIDGSTTHLEWMTRELSLGLRHVPAIASGRIDLAAFGMVGCLVWCSFAHLSRQIVVGANPHEMAAQATRGVALGIGWLLAVAAVAAIALTRATVSTEVEAVREPAPFPRPPRTPGTAGRRAQGSVDSDCTSRQATIGCVPVGQYSSSSSRRAA